MSKSFSKSIILSMIILFALFFTVQAQQADYRLNVSRTFGYGNGSDIRGTFTLSVAGPGNIRTVSYMIDNQLIAETTSDPFKFNVPNYPISRWLARSQRHRRNQ